MLNGNGYSGLFTAFFGDFTQTNIKVFLLDSCFDRISYIKQDVCSIIKGDKYERQAFHTSFVPLARHKWDSTPAA